MQYSELEPEAYRQKYCVLEHKFFRVSFVSSVKEVLQKGISFHTPPPPPSPHGNKYQSESPVIQSDPYKKEQESI